MCLLKNEPDDALRYAKLASLVLESVDFIEEDFSKEQVDNLKINAIRGAGVALHNLGLEREAYGQFMHATQTSAYRNSYSFWQPLVGRDMINSMVNIPRFKFREAQNIAKESRDTCERKGDEFTFFLVTESWLRCLIQREKWIQSQRIFMEEMERIPRLPYIGPLHRALLLKSGALLAWKLHDRNTWGERVSEAINLTIQAGLSHQLRSLKQYYGQDLDAVVNKKTLLTRV